MKMQNPKLDLGGGKSCDFEGSIVWVMSSSKSMECMLGQMFKGLGFQQVSA